MAAPDTGQHDLRIAREKQFHNQRSSLRDFINRVNEPLTGEIVTTFRDRLGDLTELDVLHIGCGGAGLTTRLVKGSPRTFVSFDIAENRVVDSKKHSRNPYESFLVADSHQLPIDTASMDLVLGMAILHHLDLSKALNEIRRVLRPKGRLVVAEPLAYHPLLSVARLLTPSARTPDEQPFRRRELEMIRRSFDVKETKYMHLLSPVLTWPSAVASRAAARWIVSTMSKVDQRIIGRFPSLGTRCWYVIIDARQRAQLTRVTEEAT